MANALNKVNSDGIEAGSIVNADIKSDAAIAGSKLADNAVGLAQMAGIARGKLIVGDSSGDPAYLAAGSNDQVLTMDANGDVGWEAPAAGGAALTGSTNNEITTVTGANAIQGEANLTWDGSVLRAKNTTNAGDGVVYVEGGEGANAVIEMVADEGDDDADKWLMKSTNGGGWHLQNKASGSWENNIVCATNNSVNLYYDNVSKFETISTGVYCKGALRIGANNAANEISDYEEGTFTPTIRANANTNGSADGTGSYVKVGKKVTIHVNIGNKTLTGFPGSGPGAIRIDGLPFVSNQANGDEFGVSSKCIIMGVDNNSNNVYFRTNNGESYLFGYYNADGSTWVYHDAGFWDNSGVYCIFNMTYFTNS